MMMRKNPKYRFFLFQSASGSYVGLILRPMIRFLLKGTRQRIAPRTTSMTQRTSSEIVSSPLYLMGRASHISLGEWGCEGQKRGLRG
ncbi:hypothetical protein J2129_000740 [Methanofollis sp. W23]|nr:hypothetical protein [Methanofollis sp. W23]